MNLVTKKSENTSPGHLGKFTKIVGKFVSLDDDKTYVVIGYRYDYKNKKRRREIKISKINPDGTLCHDTTILVSKKDVKNLIYVLKFALKFEKVFEEEDEI